MNRIDRLTAILLRLQSRRNVSVQDLATHFEISERTVFRDVRALGEAGIPIGFEKYKGYFIVEGYYVPPVMFTKEEAGAILLAGKLLDRQGDKSLVVQFDQAQQKVRAVLKTSEKEYMHELEKHIEIISPELSYQNPFPDQFLSDIKNALIEKRVLNFEYFANYTGTNTLREVEPLGICHYGNHWHLMAHCRMRNGIRDFRTDRISKLKVLTDKFDPSIRDDFKKHVFSLNRTEELKEAKILFSKNIARYVSEQKYYHGLIHEQATSDGVLMTFMIANEEYFARWLLMYTNSVEIVETDYLIQKMSQLTEELLEKYIIKTVE